MWVRKSNREIERTVSKRRFSPKRASLLSILFTPIFCIFSIILEMPNTMIQTHIFEEGSIFFYIEMVLSTYVFIFLCFYLNQLILGRPFQKKYYICSRCFEHIAFKFNTNCSCGGKLEPDYYYKWKKMPNNVINLTE